MLLVAAPINRGSFANVSVLRGRDAQLFKIHWTQSGTVCTAPDESVQQMFPQSHNRSVMYLLTNNKQLYILIARVEVNTVWRLVFTTTLFIEACAIYFHIFRKELHSS